MNEIEKALRELAKAIETNDCVEKVKVEIVLKKPKPNKAEAKPER